MPEAVTGQAADAGMREIVDADAFKRGMRRLASGVSIVTTVVDGRPAGLLATSVTSVSVEPPSLLVCINRSLSSHAAVSRAGIFCVNLLAASDRQLARRFNARENRGARFQDLRWQTLRTGAPALSGALASFDCRVCETVAVKTHTIFLAEVEALALWRDDVAPLVYLDGRYVVTAELEGESRWSLAFDPGWG